MGNVRLGRREALNLWMAAGGFVFWETACFFCCEMRIAGSQGLLVSVFVSNAELV